MRKTLLLSFMLLLCCVNSGSAARDNTRINGRISAEDGKAISYASVVLLSSDGKTQVTSTISDEKGSFTMAAPAGKYTIVVYCLGYTEFKKELTLNDNTVLQEITLTRAATELTEVTVTGRTITREADRFVVNLANNPIAIGKDAYEMLKSSPSVWVSSDGIKINGKSGTRVMVNDRLLRMDNDQLEAYLRSIKAEDIVRIEIFPDAGAEYDADSSGGIIKITLIKQRDDGLEGSVGIYGDYGYYGNYHFSPSVNVNYQAGRLNLYGNTRANIGKTILLNDETTEYTGGSFEGSELSAYSDINSKYNNIYSQLGTVYDIDNRNSVGAELGLSVNGSDEKTDGYSTFRYGPLNPADSTLNNSFYTGDNVGNYYSGTVNYTRKLDTLGSVFKLIGDYSQSVSHSDNAYNNTGESFTGGMGAGQTEDVRRSASGSNYLIASLTANTDIVLSPQTTIKTGGKYSFNRMSSNMDYDRKDNGSWTPVPEMSSTTDYTENIGALYFIYNTRLGKLGLSAGLRGEYTHVDPKLADGEGKIGEQRYFSLFPNLNLSLPLNEDKGNSLVFTYSRTISRPPFWALNSTITQLSEYSYIQGNPDLQPTFNNNFSLTGIMAHKYSLTVGTSIVQNSVRQMVVKEENNEDRLLYRHENIPFMWEYYASLNAPVNITKWWLMNLGVTGFYTRQQLVAGNEIESRLGVYVSASNMFTLPKEFYIEVSGRGHSRIMNANMIAEPSYNIDLSVKKKIAKNKFTISVDLDSFLQTVPFVLTSYGDTFVKTARVTNNNGNYMTVGLSLRYNFQAGKSVKARQVEKGLGDDAARMGQ